MSSARLHPGLFVISLLLSLTLWVYVQARSMDVRATVLPIALKDNNLSPEYVITRMDSSLSAPAHVPADQSGDPRLREMIGLVNLANATPGKHSYHVRIESPVPAFKDYLDRNSYSVVVEVERKANAKFPVTVVPRGPLSDRTLFYENSTVSPPEVSFEGPQSRVSAIASVRVWLDLSEIDADHPETTFNLEPQALDAQNHPISEVDAEPKTVTVKPSIRAASIEKTLFVVPKFVGESPSGYSILKYNFEPKSVRVTGGAWMMAQMSSVETEPIPLSSFATKPKAFAKLVLPAGVKLASKKSVISVTVELQKSAGPIELVPKVTPQLKIIPAGSH